MNIILDLDMGELDVLTQVLRLGAITYLNGSQKETTKAYVVELNKSVQKQLSVYL